MKYSQIVNPATRTMVVCLGYAYLMFSYFFFDSEKLSFAATNLDQAKDKPLLVSMNILWTGEAIDIHSLNAINSFRQNFPNVRFVHFASPEYFLGDQAAKNQKLLREVFKPNDQWGMYLRPSRKFLDYVGIKARYSPNLWGRPAKWCDDDCIKTLSLRGFSQQELSKMLAIGKDLIEDHLDKVNMIRTHDWADHKEFTEALVTNGFRYSFNPIPPDHLKTRLEGFDIFRSLEHFWSNITATTPIYFDQNRPLLTYVPETAGPTDYQTSQSILASFRKITESHKKQPAIHHIFSVSMYSNTIAQTIDRLGVALKSILSDQALVKTELQFLPAPMNIAGTNASQIGMNSSYLNIIGNSLDAIKFSRHP